MFYSKTKLSLSKKLVTPCAPPTVPTPIKRTPKGVRLIGVWLCKQLMDLRISVYFHQIVLIRFRIKWYIFSLPITACFHYDTDSCIDVSSTITAKKSRKITFSADKIHYNFIQRLQICKIPKGRNGTIQNSKKHLLLYSTQFCCFIERLQAIGRSYTRVKAVLQVLWNCIISMHYFDKK